MFSTGIHVITVPIIRTSRGSENPLSSRYQRGHLLAMIDVEMIVLFSIAMACFFALFGMLVILLHQAKAEGASGRQRQVQEREGQHATLGVNAFGQGRFGISQASVNLALSKLVPGKKPDWRFMVRNASYARDFQSTSNSQIAQSAPQSSQRTNPPARKGPRPFHYGVDRPDRAYANKDLGDLTDPQAANLARRA